MDTHARLVALYSDLGTMDAKLPVEWPVGLVFNALLEQAKKDHQDDPVIGAVERVKSSGTGGYVSGLHAGALRVLVGQMYSAYGSG